MQKDIIRVLNYFNIFSYSPDLNDIHLFLSKKSSKETLRKVLKNMVSDKKIENCNGLYTMGEYYNNLKVKSQKSKVNIQKLKVKNSKKKLKNWRFRAYVKLITLFPHIKLVGLSGSVAMNNAQESDDIDLFIISSKNRLWITRFLCVFISIILSIKRARFELHPSDKICLNLFFDESDLNIPESKKNYYVAHEVIQVKPLVNKNNVYELFLYSNKWVYDIFPNAQPQFHQTLQNDKRSVSRMTFVGNYIELILKKVQKSIINRHKTTEIITDTQLWFFPEDFEEKLPKFARKKHNA